MGRRLRRALRASRSGALAAACALGGIAAGAETPVGIWRTADGDALIEIAACDAALCGRIVWMRDPPHDDDRNNPDPALRARPLCGLEILSGFVADGDDAWSGGRVYDAKSGNTYRGTLRLEPDDALSLRGYVGIPLFGRSERWTRDAAPQRCAR